MSQKIIDLNFEEVDPLDLPEREPPPGGWQEPKCGGRWDAHRWELEIDEGRVSVRCVDPCDPEVLDLSRPLPACLTDWAPEDFTTPWDEPIRVALTFVNDSSPAGPWGPAEYGYYIEVRPYKEVGSADASR